MNKYQVTFHYSILVDAEDENDAEDSAYAFFVERLTERGMDAKDFPAVVEEVL